MLATRTRNEWLKEDASAATNAIFFSKNDITIGTKLIYHGRRRPNTVWIVVAIWTGGADHVENFRPHVRYLDDEIELHNDHGEVKRLKFKYASYAAIWWLYRKP